MLIHTHQRLTSSCDFADGFTRRLPSKPNCS